ncbi:MULTISPECIES: DUF58 domain-containing protein [Planococcus]|uniref:DUF58 domain-containing protein n=1 Tax=Planococcus faecalis TaxID=1598147 RepID=A0ABN4XT29_9BACL|nr:MULTISPECIES: DUF58 domain-containing protein [Planococcus]AQU79979.1 hypothetical protein AJGP001_12140 [Planococcus faecalis]MDJ0330655.1 DUF58 domain-containing protein [Planococcus sp. S3-L1]OHX53602.1 hypothetical protein BB777_02995 [Planococcus faecalis]
MVWMRHADDTKNMKWVLGLLIALFFMAMIFLQFLAAAVICFAATVVGLQILYLDRAGKKLVFQNNRIRKRLLYGGDSSWELVFKNEGLPIWNGQLKIWFHDAVEPKGDSAVSYGDLVEVDLPFTIGSKQTIEIDVPITGKRRGLSRIQKMELLIAHPFGEGSITLEYQPAILHEQLVFPKLQKYPFRYTPSRQKPGQFNLQHTLFDDAFQPIGTRDYVSTDQFNQIHWKASVRMQQYQTKIFSTVANESMLFALNVSAFYGTIHDLEDRIEELASYIENCFSAGVPYAVAVNIRSAGKMPYLYLSTGLGQKQRHQALELLSIISKNNATLPYRTMLGHLDMHIELPYTTYLLTDTPSDALRFITKWSGQTELTVLPSRKERDLA